MGQIKAICSITIATATNKFCEWILKPSIPIIHSKTVQYLSHLNICFINNDKATFSQLLFILSESLHTLLNYLGPVSSFGLYCSSVMPNGSANIIFITWYKLWSSYCSHNCFQLCAHTIMICIQNHNESYCDETHLLEPLKLVQWIHIPYHSTSWLLVTQFTAKNITYVIWTTKNKYLSNKFRYLGNSSHLAKLHSAIPSWKTIS
jgi:hypothetical protein